MGRPEHADARGGRGVAGAALWRRGDSRRRPAVEVKRGGGARVLSEQNQGAHEHQGVTWSKTGWSEEAEGGRSGPAAATCGGARWFTVEGPLETTRAQVSDTRR